MTTDVNVAVRLVRSGIRSLVRQYEAAAADAENKLVASLRLDPDLMDPDPGCEWVATYEVRESVTGPELGPFEQAIQVSTVWEQQPVDNSRET